MSDKIYLIIICYNTIYLEYLSSFITACLPTMATVMFKLQLLFTNVFMHIIKYLYLEKQLQINKKNK